MSNYKKETIKELKANIFEIRQKLEVEKANLKSKTEELETQAQELFDKLMEEIKENHKKQNEILEENTRKQIDGLEEIISMLETTDDENETNNEIETEENEELDQTITIIFEDGEEQYERNNVNKIPMIKQLLGNQNELYLFRSKKHFETIMDIVENREIDCTERERKEIVKECQFYQIEYSHMKNLIEKCHVNSIDKDIIEQNSGCVIQKNIIKPRYDDISYVQFTENIRSITLRVKNDGGFIFSRNLSFGICEKLTEDPVIGKNGVFITQLGEVFSSISSSSVSVYYGNEIDEDKLFTFSYYKQNGTIGFKLEREDELPINYYPIDDDSYLTIIMCGDEQEVEIVSIEKV